MQFALTRLGNDEEAWHVRGFLRAEALNELRLTMQAVPITSCEALPLLTVVGAASPIFLWDYPRGTPVVAAYGYGQKHFLPWDFAIESEAEVVESVRKYPVCLSFVPPELQTEAVQAAACRMVCEQPWIINDIAKPSRALQCAALGLTPGRRRLCSKALLAIFPSLDRFDCDLLDSVDPKLSLLVRTSRSLPLMERVMAIASHLK